MLDVAQDDSATVSPEFLICEGHKLRRKCVETDNDKKTASQATERTVGNSQTSAGVSGAFMRLQPDSRRNYSGLFRRQNIC